MIHPARSMVESLHAKGACPRIQVDLTRDGVVCPDFVCEKWKEELVIDLDPGYPLNLEFTAEGIEADLSFGGYVTRCTFPFHAIYVVADRDTGKGVVIEENMPEAVRKKRQLAPGPAPEANARAEGKRDKSTGRRRKRPQPKLGLEAAPEPVQEPDEEVEADDVATTEADEEAQAKGAAEEEAQRRRSVFQVIDGDG